MGFEETRKYFESRNQFHGNPELVSEQLSKFYRDDEITVFHEVVSLDFHLDVYFIKSERHKFNILLTSGMSLMEMNIEEGIKSRDSLKFAEVAMLIPKDFVIEQVQPGDGENDWIISMLKDTAKFPHYYDTWLTVGHTIQSTEDLSPYCSHTKYVGVIILPLFTTEPGFNEIKTDDIVINIYNIFPLYRNELEYKIKNGTDALFDLIRKANPSEVFNNSRKNLLGSGKWYPFGR